MKYIYLQIGQICACVEEPSWDLADGISEQIPKKQYVRIS